MINVVKSFLPPFDEYQKLLEKVWKSGWITNNGPCLIELEEKLKKHLDVPYFSLTNNGTIAIQIAIKALALKGDIITTPFSYVATTSSIVWEGCSPVFADIQPNTLCIDAEKIEEKITSNTCAILATHVFGIPCDVEKIQAVADKHGLKVIYDAAHAFGVDYKDQSILNYGDMSTLSFHATKLFHTVEGGAVICKEKSDFDKVGYMRNFGHNGKEAFHGLGINGKNSEFHAAMGLSIFPYISEIIEKRRARFEQYVSLLEPVSYIETIAIPQHVTYNYGYMPIVLESHDITMAVIKKLNEQDIYPRRYFFPSLDTLPYIDNQSCPISNDISSRVLCLPLYPDLTEENVNRIINTLSE